MQNFMHMARQFAPYMQRQATIQPVNQQPISTGSSILPVPKPTPSRPPQGTIRTSNFINNDNTAGLGEYNITYTPFEKKESATDKKNENCRSGEMKDMYGECHPMWHFFGNIAHAGPNWGKPGYNNVSSED